MLVLTRKQNESIMVGDSVEITVVEVRGLYSGRTSTHQKLT